MKNHLTSDGSLMAADTANDNLALRLNPELTSRIQFAEVPSGQTTCRFEVDSQFCAPNDGLAAQKQSLNSRIHKFQSKSLRRSH
jgi:hypothetical protein